jgi:carbon monoxide dehydrogenase subunit G
MKISGSHLLSVPQPRAYDLLQNPAVLAKAMPGCDTLERIGDNEFHMKMKMVLASISGLFDGKVRIADPQPPSSFRLIVEGAGKIGFMKGDGLLTLTPDGGGTNVAFDGSVEVGGTIAAVGHRLLDTTARMIIKRFFEKLTAEAATSRDAAAPPAPPPPS